MGIIREYTSGPGFARRAVFAQSLRAVLVPSAVLILIFTALGVGLALSGPPDVSRNVVWVLALFIALYAAIIAASLLIAYRSTRKHIPEGSRFTAQLRDSSLAFSGPLGTADVAYSAYRRVERRHGFVLLRMRASRLSTVIPAELMPGDDYDRLVAEVAAAASAPPQVSDEPPLDNWFVTDKAFVGRITRATTRYALTRPAIMVILIIVALPGGLGVLLFALSLLLQRDLLVGLPPIIFSVVIIGASIGLSYAAIARVQRRLYPVGGRVELQLTDSGIAMRNAVYQTELPYDRVRGLQRRGEFTILRTRPGQTIIPSRLLPPEAEQRLLAAIS